MSNTGTKIIEQGSTAGGIAKVQYLDESGNVLYEVNDSDKIFKMINGKISGLAGAGTRMVVADSSGNLYPLTYSRLADGYDLNTLSMTINTGGWSLTNAPSQEFIYIENIAIAPGMIKQKAYSSGVYNGSSYTRWERECKNGVWTAWRSGLCDASLAGTGNRAVYSDALGVLTNTSSDVRVKKNISNLSNSINVLETLKQIRGVTYNWDTEKEGYETMGTQQEIGVIAQEIEQYIPQIVGENSTGYKSVDYAKLTAYLIEVNKALFEKIESLETR